ncbi:MAG: EAL domain-containing protein [Geminicoccales bacterium]
MRLAINDKILLPVFAFVGCSMAMLGGFVWYSAAQQDVFAVQQSISSARSSIENKLEQIGVVARDFAWRNDAVRHLDIAFSENWADSNLGYYIHDEHDYDMSFVISRDRRTIYGHIDGRRVNTQVEDLFKGGLDRMLIAAQDAPWRNPDPVTGILTTSTSVVLVGLSAVSLEQQSNINMAEGNRVVVVLAKRLTPNVVLSITDSLHLQDVQLETAKPDDPTTQGIVPLRTPDNKIAAYLTWEPFQPGQQFLQAVTPALATAVIAILGFTWLLIWRVRASTKAIKLSEARFRDVADASSDWIWETDELSHLRYLSEQFAKSTGTAVKHVLNKPIGDILQPTGNINKTKQFKTDLKEHRHFRDILCRYVDGQNQKKTLRVAGKPIFSAGGKFQGFRGTATDITTEMDAKRRIQHLAHHDSLTSLPNRAQLRKRLAKVVENVSLGAGQAAVLCIDLDRFKEINDTLGHSAGDLLIKGCASRLRAAVRETDTIARIGGDEFAIVQTGIEQPAGAHQLCQRLLKSITCPYNLDGHEVLVTGSIGVAIADGQPQTPERLLQKADIALYRAKEEGRNAYRCFQHGMDDHLHQRKKMEHDLRKALVNQELELFYQPKLELRQNRIFGAEALLRWHHPELQLVKPDQFIGLAEETGLILGLGEWVLHAACKQAAKWPSLAMSLNISPVQFKHHDVVTMVKRCLADTGVEPNRIELEITEGVLLRNTEAAVSTLKALKDIGVRIVMDDFGTRYSGLSYLLKFPFDKIKIDQSFVRNVRTRRDAEAIVRAVVGLGRNLDMRICAEGVETASQLSFLEDEGCDEVQGYFVGEPMPAKMFESAFMTPTPALDKPTTHNRTLTLERSDYVAVP